MFRLKYVISTTLVLILLSITSIIKNQTRILEKKLSKLNKEINLKEQDINESQLDFYFLTSPAELEKKIKTISQNNYSPIENSKIFLNLTNFTNIKRKISLLENKDKNEKKAEKN
jgi:hypothetical protein